MGVAPGVEPEVDVAPGFLVRSGTRRLAWRSVPTVRRIGGARFFFFSNEGTEPPHVHVEQGRGLAKFWLDPVSLASSSRLRSHEIRRIERLVVEHEEAFLEAWREFFGA